jgi:hypothetical protein
MEHESYFATRHARPERNKSQSDPASTEYPDLTEEGVEQAKGKARGEILALIDDSPDGAIIFIGATSDQPRTKQTAEIYGDALSMHSKEVGLDSVLVITKSEIEEMTKEDDSNSYAKIIKRLQELAKANPDKKIVIDYPLMVKQLAYKYDSRWTDAKGNKTDYFSAVLKKHENNHEEAGKDWLANNGALTTTDNQTLQGPIPEKVAKDYLEGIRRVREFVMRYAGDRPVVIGEIGHQWDIDALVTYLAKGKVDFDSFEQVTGGEIAGEAEMTRFEINRESTQVTYRGKKFNLPEYKA